MPARPHSASQEPQPESAGFAEVVFNLPLTEKFTYRIPETLRGLVRRGMRVFVPFGRRRITGYVVGLAERCEAGFAIKDIEEVLDAEPIVGEDLLELTRWAGEYYCASWGETLRAALPAGLDEEARELFSLSPGLTGAPEPILQFLHEHPGGKSLKQIQRALGRDFSPAAFARLRREGKINSEARIQRSAIASINEKVARLVVSGADLDSARSRLSRSPMQLRVFDLLAEGEKSLAEISILIPKYAAALRGLRQKSLAETVSRRISRASADKCAGDIAGETPLKFTPGQEDAFKKVASALDASRFEVFLLHGVTGSGKTEIYLRCIRKVLDAGRSAVMLVPEISLTPQTVERFRRRFGDRVAILHSGLSNTERYREWKAIREGKVFIAVGARSAVFAPFARLGLIVIDEEHDSSYKQDTSPRYHARDTAIMRARAAGAAVVLGSATPSLESRRNAEVGKYRLVSLPDRVGDRLLPAVEIIDMRVEKDEKKNFSLLSHPLKNAVLRRLERREQVFLFLNRRGTANYVFCRDCGFVFQCLRCSVTLTFHGVDEVLRCHYCDFRAARPDLCPECGAEMIRFNGFGTQKLEAEVRRLFPSARVLRLDRDTTHSRAAFDDMYRSMAGGETDILIGTQMITKGHDFPNVTLVGVVQADISLNVPDFRSCERTFQLLTQVAGRAGRGDVPGRVIIQTHHPDHYVFGHVCGHDYEKFYAAETEIRRQLHYPPYSRLAVLEVECADEVTGETLTEKLGRDLRAAIDRNSQLDLIGPAPAALYRINDRFRWHLILRAESASALQALLGNGETLRRWKKLAQGKAKLSLDVDPVNML